MEMYKCDFETAERYCDLRDEGHSVYEAKLLSGLCDPSYAEEENS
jgi:hypothetical protein